MLLMHRNRQARATWVMEVLGLSDGNMRSHAEKLAAAGYLEQRRTLTKGGFQVVVRITPNGDRAFRSYVDALAALLREADAEASGVPALRDLLDSEPQGPIDNRQPQGK